MNNQFGSFSGKGALLAVFLLRQVQEKISELNNKRYWTFVDLEKAFDRVPRDAVGWSLSKTGETEKTVRLVKSMHEDAKTSVRCRKGRIQTIS